MTGLTAGGFLGLTSPTGLRAAAAAAGPLCGRVQKVQRVVVAAAPQNLYWPPGALPPQRYGQPTKRKALLWAG